MTKNKKMNRTLLKMNKIMNISFIIILLLLDVVFAQAQQKKMDSASFYNEVKTYVNPVLPGDHPDPTLFRKGKDFYYCGSSFHFTPYLPIYHSTDLVHWEIVSRVVYPQNAGFVQDEPSKGIWQGAITYFNHFFWIYFSANGDQQWFSKATTAYGPWSKPVMVKTTPQLGPLGYDNSIFIDDDGQPYMLIKNGQKINRIHAIGKDGQLTGKMINLDWINAHLQYSWAEGPVMCKRNGYYYYFPAGSVAGGQYVLRTKVLTGDSTKWERLGNFFKPLDDPNSPFRVANHIGAPLQLADGTWWTLAQSYEDANDDDWSGTGRQTSLCPVIWDGDRPWGIPPTSYPVIRPDLPQANGILWRSVHSDYFKEDRLNVCWHFLNRRAETECTLLGKSGWVRLSPKKGERAHLLQKETDHYYNAVTRVKIDENDTTSSAGLYLTNGNQSVNIRLFAGYKNSNKIILQLDTAIRSIPNTFGNTVWLKLERKGHFISGYCSSDDDRWVSLGAPISSVPLDKVQPKWNAWVGTSLGLFAENKPADFNCFICKDGFSSMPAIGYRNYFGIKMINKDAITNTSESGGWAMISGVDLGTKNNSAAKINITASALTNGTMQVWLDDLKNGKLIATIPIPSTGGKNNWKVFSGAVNKLSGHHDVFVKFLKSKPGNILIQSIRFSK